MRDPEFEVSSVRESDVIHANKKDVSCIFRVTTSLMDPPGVRHQCLMLADSESEKTKWVVALNELHRDGRTDDIHDADFGWKTRRTEYPANMIPSLGDCQMWHIHHLSILSDERDKEIKRICKWL